MLMTGAQGTPPPRAGLQFSTHFSNCGETEAALGRSVYILILASGERRPAMLGWALTFLVIALIAGLFGFGGIAGASASIAQILFFIFLVLLVISLVMHFVRRA